MAGNENLTTHKCWDFRRYSELRKEGLNATSDPETVPRRVPISEHKKKVRTPKKQEMGCATMRGPKHSTWELHTTNQQFLKKEKSIMKTSRNFQIVPVIAKAFRTYQSLPPLAKTYALVCFMTTTASHLELYNTRTIALFYSDVFKRFQVWRLVTNFFFLGGFSLPFAFRILAILYYGAALEEGPFDKRTADYIWMYIVGGSSVLVMATIPFMWFPFNGSAIVFMILYVWSRENPDARVKMKGLFQIKGLLLPWVTLGIDTIFGYPWMSAIQGIAAGHIYFCTVLLPFSTGSNYFRTPHWVHRIVESWAEDDRINSPAKQDPDAETVFQYKSYRPIGSFPCSRASARPETSSSSAQVQETTQPTRMAPSKSFRGKSRGLLVGR